MNRFLRLLYSSMICSALIGTGTASFAAKQAVCAVTSLKEPLNCKDGDILLYEPKRTEAITMERTQVIFPWDIAALYCDFDKMILDQEKLVCVFKRKSNADEIFERKVQKK